MIVNYFSDIHLEFRNETILDYFTSSQNADVIVIAGDITSGNHSSGVLRTLANQVYPKPVIYVAGNHDSYHSDKMKVYPSLHNMSQECENFHFLNRSAVTIDDVTFIGATGWQIDENYTYECYELINDFHLIKGHKKDVLTYGRRDKTALADLLCKYSGNKIVVVTHLVPCVEAINFGTYEVESKRHYIKAYYNNYNDIMETYQPNVWVCGHCHDSFDGIVNNTRIVRNALGYIGTDRENRDFDKTKTFTI